MSSDKGLFTIDQFSQTSPAGLPEKEWFTLEEVAARWGMSVDDVLNYGVDGRLTICAYFKDVKIARCEHQDKSENGFEFIRTEKFRRLYSPLPINKIDLIEIKNGNSMVIVGFPSDNMNFSFSSQHDHNSNYFYVVEAGVEIDLKDLVLVRSERERFERVNCKGK